MCLVKESLKKFEPLFSGHAPDVVVKGEGCRKQRSRGSTPGPRRTTKFGFAVTGATSGAVNCHVKTPAKNGKRSKIWTCPPGFKWSKKGIENSLVFKRLFWSPSCNHRLNKTGLQPVSRNVEKILGFFQGVLTSTLNLPYHLKLIKEYI